VVIFVIPAKVFDGELRRTAGIHGPRVLRSVRGTQDHNDGFPRVLGDDTLNHYNQQLTTYN